MSTSDSLLLGLAIALVLVILIGLLLLVIAQLRQISRSLPQPRPASAHSFASSIQPPTFALADTDGHHRRWASLTPREREVASLAASHSDAEIARRLSISPKTVKNHLYNIYGKLEINSRAELKYIAPNVVEKSDSTTI